MVEFAASDAAVPIGVLLYDSPSRRVFYRFRGDYHRFASEYDAEVLGLLGDDLAKKFAEVVDPIQVIEHLEDTLSNAIRISGRVDTTLPNGPEAAVDAIFRMFVGETAP